VEKPLTATAMAVEAGGEQMVLVSTDLVGVGGNLMDLIRERLAGNSMGLDPGKVMFSAIHTHTGPVYPHMGYIEKTLGITQTARALLKSMLPADRKYIESAIKDGTMEKKAKRNMMVTFAVVFGAGICFSPVFAKVIILVVAAIHFYVLIFRIRTVETV